MTPRSPATLFSSALASIFILAAPAYAGVVLTPSTNGSQEHISFFADTDISFVVNDDDWADRIGLPEMTGRETSRSVTVSNRSSHGNFELLGPINGIPGGRGLIIPAGEELGFSHSHFDGMGWYPHFGANYRELRLPAHQHPYSWQLPSAGRKLLTRAVISATGHAREIVLPSSPRPYDVVVVANVTNGSTEVAGTNLLFPNASRSVPSRESHMYVYDPHYRKWKLSFAPYHDIPLNEAGGPVYSSRNSVSLQDGNWMASVPLPSNWHTPDRNRRIVRSSATWDSEISFNGQRLPLRKGDEYEFIRIHEGAPGSSRWELLRHPTLHLNLHDHRLGNLPEALYPVTWISVRPGDGNVQLPKGRQGARIVVENKAQLAHQAVTITAPGVFERAKRGEQVSFRMEDGYWKRETVTIDLAFAVDARLGQIGSTDDALALMRESLRLTNQALDNSGATFRFREAGYYSTAVPTHLNSREAAQWLRANADIQRVLRNGQFDGVYYAGASMSDCGASHHSPSAKELILVSSLLCSTTDLREQAGVALGLPLLGDRASIIGAGNRIPLYPTPHRFLDDGSRADHGQRDWVSHMNQVAQRVAQYSNAR